MKGSEDREKVLVNVSNNESRIRQYYVTKYRESLMDIEKLSNEIVRLKRALRKYEGCIDEIEFMNKENNRLVMFIKNTKNKIGKITEGL